MKISIIGAGISGLLSAYYLSKAGHEIEIFEKLDRPGGLIETLDTPYGPMDFAASSLINSKDFEAVFKDIGLEYAIKSPSAAIKNIYRNGMKRWPLGPLETMRLIFGAGVTFIKKDKGLSKGQTVKSWGERALGKAGYKYLLETFLQGVYAGDCSKMSASLVLGPMFAKKKKRVKPAVRGSAAPIGGMGKLIEKLAQYLQNSGVVVHYGTTLNTNDISAHHPTIIATSGPAAGKLLTQLGVNMGTDLAEQQMLDLANVHFVFEGKDPLFKGFGCLFPVGEGIDSLGILAGKNAFPDEYPYPVERWIMGGAHSPDLLQLTDDDLIKLALNDRKKITGEVAVPKHSYVQRRPKSLPHYTAELETMLEGLVLPDNLYLVGNYLGGIGLTAIIRDCELLVERVKNSTDLRGKHPK